MIKIILFSCFTLISLSACNGKMYPPDCAADGPNCKQFNPGLDQPVTAPDCAADGPGCKMFNPDKP